MFFALCFAGMSGFLVGALFLWREHTARKIVEKERDMVAKDLRTTTQQLEQLHIDNASFREQAIALEAEKKQLLNKAKEEAQQKKMLEEKLFLEFKALSSDLLQHNSVAFSKQNREQMDLLLKPLHEKISDFQKQVIAAQQTSHERNVVLKQEFEKVHQFYEKMHQDASKTTKAIMGDNKMQGTWGEMHALQLLERTGLRKNEQYFVQKSFSTSEGKRYMPDIIIKLPGARSLVVDVKVSLVDYVKFFNAEESKKEHYLKKHIHSIRNHIKTLSEKNYAQLYELHGLDFVLMLLPLEPAFSLAVQHAPALLEEAYVKNVVLVSPTTLQATLFIIEHIWRDANRNRHALQIAQQSGALYDKFVSFVEDIKKISRQLQLSQQACDQAMKKLSEGKGNLVSKAEKLKKLGARTSKTLEPQF